MKKFIFVHQGVSGEVCEAINRFGFTVVRLPSFIVLNALIREHPDSLVFPLPDGRILLHSDYYGANGAFFDVLGLPVATTDEPIGEKYPDDILLNALVLGSTLYGRLDKISRMITGAYAERVNVKQGYARCSVLALGDNAAVIADRGLAGALGSRGVDVLLLPPGGIRLGSGIHAAGKYADEKYAGGKYADGGFIGGSGVMLRGDLCGFFGDINGYAHYAELCEFADAHGVELVSLGTFPLSDLGGAVIV